MEEVGILQQEDQKPIELCPDCKKARASTRKSRRCSTCHRAWVKALPKNSVPGVLSPELIGKMALAKTTEDWQKLAAELAPTFAGILSGDVKATAAQASLLKDVQNRAFGKPVATQAEKKVAAGVIVLPTLDSGMNMQICPKCGFDATKNLVAAQQGTTDSVSSVNS